MRNLTLLTDLYQLTMMYGYHKCGMEDNRAVFDMFYRQQTDTMNYAIFAGLEQLIGYVADLHFDPKDLEYLDSLGLFDQSFLDRLANFRFTGDLDAVPEGTLVFPGEPLVRVNAPIFQAQLVETALLNIVNHQTLIATKAGRVTQAAGENASVLEFGLRRPVGAPLCRRGRGEGRAFPPRRPSRRAGRRAPRPPMRFRAAAGFRAAFVEG